MIKEKAYKIVEMSTSKTGKHGHAKCKFVGVNIFDGTKAEKIESSTHNVDVPHVTRTEYQLLDIDDDEGFLSLMDSEGNTKDDLKLPKDEELATKIKDALDGEKDVFVTVLSAIDIEQVIDMKVSQT